jgi:NAD-dependent dihydropyrimidine dehydrogenase PreA subunit
MILNRNYYEKTLFWRGWWFRRQIRKLAGDRIFKVFKLHKTIWPDKLYFYSPRLKGKPLFIGTKEKLSQWKESKLCETICPTQAIEVTVDAIIIDDRGCIGCGLCVDFAPSGLLEMSAEVSTLHRS